MKNDGWIKFDEFNHYHQEVVDNFMEVLDEMGICVTFDCEEAEEQECEAFIRLERRK